MVKSKRCEKITESGKRREKLKNWRSLVAGGTGRPGGGGWRERETQSKRMNGREC
jgi:hypothetical protein